MRLWLIKVLPTYSKPGSDLALAVGMTLRSAGGRSVDRLFHMDGATYRSHPESVRS